MYPANIGKDFRVDRRNPCGAALGNSAGDAEYFEGTESVVHEGTTGVTYAQILV